MTPWRLDLQTPTGTETTWSTTEADADRALWRMRLTTVVRYAVVWEDGAAYEACEVGPWRPNRCLAGLNPIRVTPGPKLNDPTRGGA